MCVWIHITVFREIDFWVDSSVESLNSYVRKCTSYRYGYRRVRRKLMEGPLAAETPKGSDVNHAVARPSHVAAVRKDGPLCGVARSGGFSSAPEVLA